jgi:hypothetical protein
MTVVKLTKNGKFRTSEWIKPEEWNPVTHKHAIDGYHRFFDLKSADGVLCHWKEYFVIEEGATLGSLFTAIRDITEYEKLGIMFENAWMKEFIEEAFSPVERDTEMNEIVWSWHATIGDEYVGGDEEDEDEDGSGKDTCRTIKNGFSYYGNINGKSDDVDNWAIDGCPQNIYFDVPIRLDETFNVLDSENYKTNPYAMKAVKTWTFGEFLYVYFWEISFHGGPIQREAFNVMLSESLAESMANPGQGRPADEVFAELFADLEDKENGGLPSN